MPLHYAFPLKRKCQIEHKTMYKWMFNKCNIFYQKETKKNCSNLQKVSRIFYRKIVHIISYIKNLHVFFPHLNIHL